MPLADQAGQKDQNPSTLSQWNWGALLLNVVWGAKHNVDVAFLTLVPVLGLIVPFVLGAKGNEWAWKNGTWKSAEEFEKTQSNWTFWGIIVWFFLIVCLFIPIMHGITNLRWTFSSVYRQTAAEFVKVRKIQEVLGGSISYRIYEAKDLNSQRVRIGIKFSGEASSFKARFYLMPLEKKWAVYRITIFDPDEKSAVDFPLPVNLLLYGPGYRADEGVTPPRNYSVVLESAGDAPLRHLAQVIFDFNRKLTVQQAMDMVRFTPKKLFINVTYAGAMKIKYKLEDFGAKVSIQEGAAAK